MSSKISSTCKSPYKAVGTRAQNRVIAHQLIISQACHVLQSLYFLQQHITRLRQYFFALLAGLFAQLGKVYIIGNVASSDMPVPFKV